MKFSYARYAIAYSWASAQDQRDICCPDELLDVAIKDLATSYPLLRDHYNSAVQTNQALPVAVSPHDRLAQCQDLISACINEIDPQNRYAFQQLNKPSNFKVDTDPFYTGGYLDTTDHKNIIHLTQNGSIGDLIYAAHEFGHLIAIKDQTHTKQSYLRETQAFFLQETAYDILSKNNATKQDAAHHRAQEILMVLHNYDRADLVNKLNASSKLPPSEHNTLCDQAYPLHSHFMGIVLANGLYTAFKNAPDHIQNNVLEALYMKGENASLTNILCSIGISTIDETQNFIGNSLNELKSYVHSMSLQQSPANTVKFDLNEPK